MNNAWGLTLVAIGAIFAFAVSGHPSWVNLHIVGWVIMLTGIIGMVLRRVDTGRFPPWLIIWRSSKPQQPPGGGQPPAITGTVISDEPVTGSGAPPTASAPGGTPGGGPPGAAAPGETFPEP